jgi:hypothetical protein
VLKFQKLEQSFRTLADDEQRETPLRHELRFSDRSAFVVSDISFLADAPALFRSARRAVLCTETNLEVIGLRVGPESRFPF